jgi:hypothetical protein
MYVNYVRVINESPSTAEVYQIKPSRVGDATIHLFLCEHSSSQYDLRLHGMRLFGRSIVSNVDGHDEADVSRRVITSARLIFVIAFWTLTLTEALANSAREPERCLQAQLRR